MIVVFGLEPGRVERGDHLLDVLGPASLQDEFDLDVLGRQQGEGPLMMDLGNVGMGLGNQMRGPRQRAGQVIQRHADARQAAGAQVSPTPPQPLEQGEWWCSPRLCTMLIVERPAQASAFDIGEGAPHETILEPDPRIVPHPADPQSRVV